MRQPCLYAALVLAGLHGGAVNADAAPPQSAAGTWLKHRSIKGLDYQAGSQFLRAGTLTSPWTLNKAASMERPPQDGQRLLWVVKGEVLVRAPQGTFRLGSGEVLLVPAHAGMQVSALDDAAGVELSSPAAKRRGQGWVFGLRWCACGLARGAWLAPHPAGSAWPAAQAPLPPAGRLR